MIRNDTHLHPILSGSSSPKRKGLSLGLGSAVVGVALALGTLEGVVNEERSLIHQTISHIFSGNAAENERPVNLVPVQRDILEGSLIQIRDDFLQSKDKEEIIAWCKKIGMPIEENLPAGEFLRRERDFYDKRNDSSMEDLSLRAKLDLYEASHWLGSNLDEFSQLLRTKGPDLLDRDIIGGLAGDPQCLNPASENIRSVFKNQLPTTEGLLREMKDSPEDPLAAIMGNKNRPFNQSLIIASCALKTIGKVRNAINEARRVAQADRPNNQTALHQAVK